MKQTLFALVMVGSLVGCGADEAGRKAEGNQDFVKASGVEADQAKAALPNMVMVRVPVDAQGNLLVDKAETRTLKTSSNDFASAELASAAFSNAQEVSVATDDLDSDTSTNSWYWGYGYRGYNYWNTPWYPGKALGRGMWWGRNPYVWYGGSPYYYNYYNSYNFGGYNYYSYCWW